MTLYKWWGKNNDTCQIYEQWKWEIKQNTESSFEYWGCSFPLTIESGIGGKYRVFFISTRFAFLAIVSASFDLKSQSLKVIYQNAVWKVDDYEGSLCRERPDFSSNFGDFGQRGNNLTTIPMHFLIDEMELHWQNHDSVHLLVRHIFTPPYPSAKSCNFFYINFIFKVFSFQILPKTKRQRKELHRRRKKRLVPLSSLPTDYLPNTKHHYAQSSPPLPWSPSSCS